MSNFKPEKENKLKIKKEQVYYLLYSFYILLFIILHFSVQNFLSQKGASEISTLLLLHIAVSTLRFPITMPQRFLWSNKVSY